MKRLLATILCLVSLNAGAVSTNGFIVYLATNGSQTNIASNPAYRFDNQSNYYAGVFVGSGSGLTGLVGVVANESDPVFSTNGIKLIEPRPTTGQSYQVFGNGVMVVNPASEHVLLNRTYASNLPYDAFLTADLEVIGVSGGNKSIFAISDINYNEKWMTIVDHELACAWRWGMPLGGSDIFEFWFDGAAAGAAPNEVFWIQTSGVVTYIHEVLGIDATSTNAFPTLAQMNAATNGLIRDGDTLLLGLAGPDAVATNAYVTKSQWIAGQVGSMALRFTGVTTGTYTNGIEPVTQVYAAKSGEYPVSSVLTNQIAATGQYGCLQIWTNQSFVRVPAQDVSIDVYTCESGAGSMVGKWEFYWYDTVRGVLEEFGEGGRTYTVTAGTTPMRDEFAIQVNELNTNNPCYAAVRFKWLSGAQDTLLVGVGTNYQSHFAFNVSSDVLLDGYATEAYVDTGTNNILTGVSAFSKAKITGTNGTTLELYPSTLGGTQTLAVVLWGTNRNIFLESH